MTLHAGAEAVARLAATRQECRSGSRNATLSRPGTLGSCRPSPRPTPVIVAAGYGADCGQRI